MAILYILMELWSTLNVLKWGLKANLITCSVIKCKRCWEIFTWYISTIQLYLPR